MLPGCAAMKLFPNKIISFERLRRALAHLAPAPCKYDSEEERAARAVQLAKSTTWMDKALCESTQESLRTPWILDADTSVKLLYGHQAGAEIGYNPTKPGRPNHTLHTYRIGNIRLVLDVEVQSGSLDYVLANAPQLTKADRWGVLARYIINKIIATKPKNSQLLGFLPPSLAIEVT